MMSIAGAAKRSKMGATSVKSPAALRERERERERGRGGGREETGGEELSYTLRKQNYRNQTGKMRVMMCP